MSKLNLSQKVLCILMFLFVGTGLMAQSSLRDQVDDPIIDDPVPSSLDEILGFENLKVYTNYYSIRVNFTNQSNELVQVQVYDIAGREIVNKKLQKTNSQFNFQYDSSHLPRSIYIVRLTQGKTLASKKVYL